MNRTEKTTTATPLDNWEKCQLETRHHDRREASGSSAMTCSHLLRPRANSPARRCRFPVSGQDPHSFPPWQGFCTLHLRIRLGLGTKKGERIRKRREAGEEVICQG